MKLVVPVVESVGHFFTHFCNAFPIFFLSLLACVVMGEMGILFVCLFAAAHLFAYSIPIFLLVLLACCILGNYKDSHYGAIVIIFCCMLNAWFMTTSY